MNILEEIEVCIQATSDANDLLNDLTDFKHENNIDNFIDNLTLDKG